MPSILTTAFQFHKGTIKTGRNGSIVVPCHYFNSIKVRLKRRNKVIFVALLSFQFHKGTIKTAVGCQHVREVLGFQFHKGTIKTDIARCSDTNKLISIP